MDTFTKLASSTVVTGMTVQTVRVSEHAFLYRSTRTDTRDGVAGVPHIRQGFLNNEQHAELVSADTIFDHPTGIPRCHVLSPEHIKLAQSRGWSVAFASHDSPEIDYEMDLWTTFENGEWAEADVYILGSANHTLQRLDETHVPTAFLVSYMNFNLDNEHYDLERAAEILKARDDIEFTTEDRWTEVDPENPITDVPYYNCNDECSKQIAFYWCPSDEQAQVLGGKGTMRGVDIIAQKDMLDIECARLKKEY